MPQPVHGSAPDIAGQDIANPMAMVMSAAMMCKYDLNCTKVRLLHFVWLLLIAVRLYAIVVVSDHRTQTLCFPEKTESLIAYKRLALSRTFCRQIEWEPHGKQDGAYR